MGSAITHGKVLCIDVENLYCKTTTRFKGSVSHQNIPHTQRRASFQKERRKKDWSGNHSIVGRQKYHQAIRRMLKKHLTMRSDILGEINIIWNPMELITGTRTSKSTPYRAGPKARELQQSDFSKQLAAEAIEPTYYVWASSVLFATKKDGSLRYFYWLLRKTW